MDASEDSQGAATSAAAPQGEPPAVPPRRGGALREYVEAFAVALLLALGIRCFVVQAFRIPSGSMSPTLEVGDHILANKFIYGVRLPILGTLLIPVRTPRRGDILVFAYPRDPRQDFIKRVIGIGGDVVAIRHKRVYINGKLWNDPHAYFAEGRNGDERPRDEFGPVRVPRDQLFVMGDNRDRSYDSRYWGFVDLREVRGEALLIYWSWDAAVHRVRWRRLGEVIH